MTRVVAVVPVRKGSVRVPNKSMRPFGETTLLKRKIQKLKKVKNLTKIIVSSDGEGILQTAFELGVDIHKREPYFADSSCSGTDFFKNLASSINSDVLVYTPPTSPFIEPETIEEAISRYMKEDDFDSVATVHPVKHHMWIDGHPLNYDISSSPNSQDLPEIFRITYGVCVNSNDNILKCGNVVGKSPCFMEIGEIEAVDIDTMMDFSFAEYLQEKEITDV